MPRQCGTEVCSAPNPKWLSKSSAHAVRHWSVQCCQHQMTMLRQCPGSAALQGTATALQFGLGGPEFSHFHKGVPGYWHFYHGQGGTRKNWRWPITNRQSPLLIKNDNSLILHNVKKKYLTSNVCCLASNRCCMIAISDLLELRNLALSPLSSCTLPTRLAIWNADLMSLSASDILSEMQKICWI